jgi:hypothetical protein
MIEAFGKPLLAIHICTSSPLLKTPTSSPARATHRGCHGECVIPSTEGGGFLDEDLGGGQNGTVNVHNGRNRTTQK